LAPRLLALVVQQGESSLAQFLGGGPNSVRVVRLELQAHLWDGAIRRPVRCAEAPWAACDSGHTPKCLLPSIRSLWK